LLPDLARAVHLKVLAPHALHLSPQDIVAVRARRSPRRIDLPDVMAVIRRRGNLHHRADRLDPILVAVGVDKRHPHFGRRSSSA
jgi:hypothetical protein